MKKTQKTYILAIVSGIVAVFAFTISVPTSAHAQMYTNYGYGSAGNSYGYGGGYGSYGGYGGYNGGYSNGYNGGYNNGGYNNGGYGGYGGYGDHGGYNPGPGPRPGGLELDRVRGHLRVVQDITLWLGDGRDGEPQDERAENGP